MTEEQVDAPYESTRDAGSTPATSTILPSVYGALGVNAKLLPDYRRVSQNWPHRH